MAERLWARPSGSTRRAPRIRKTTSEAIRSCKPTRSTRRPGFSARTIRTCKCQALGSKSSRSCKFRACELEGRLRGPFFQEVFSHNLLRQGSPDRLLGEECLSPDASGVSGRVGRSRPEAVIAALRDPGKPANDAR